MDGVVLLIQGDQFRGEKLCDGLVSVFLTVFGSELKNCLDERGCVNRLIHSDLLDLKAVSGCQWVGIVG